ncbi:putative nuclease HARBI1, partial [Ceratina calcarata]|uniref:Nuclease HARBI1 n=1 Tax=Ceratina calcarata TaxID=156304 RepID=A0AAJ7N3C8_9HYME
NPRLRRYVRDGQNPFEYYEDAEFKRRYRFSKESVLCGILPKIIDGLKKVNNRGLPIAPELQLLMCLRYYASSSFQQVLGDTMGISQPTVSRIVNRVSDLLGRLIFEYIKFPNSDEARRENRRLFRDLGQGSGAIGLPGIDGAIDCTHVRLTCTRLNDVNEIFRNRKGYFSLNVQAVVGPRMEFLDLVPEWPGSAHDSRIFQNSRVHMRYAERQLDGMLVGDRGYPCLPFLMTPLANPRTDEERTYNNIHTRTRQIVERTFGVWKRRFPCLSRGLTTQLLCSTTTVVACAVLHNMSLIFRDILPEEEENDVDMTEEPQAPAVEEEHASGLAAREALINRMFS